MKNNNPFVDSPSPGWKYDLPRPNEKSNCQPCPDLMIPPNDLNSIFIELPRATFRVRGVGMLGAVLFIFMCFFPIDAWLELFFSSRVSPDAMDSLSTLLAIVFSVWVSVYLWRVDLEAPVDEPIRFNRARRKVYVYRFHNSKLKIWGTSSWGVRVEAYDWDDLHAEFCSFYGPMGSGGLSESIILTVLEPRTNKVRERFLFAHGGLEGEMYWATVQIFMQQGAHALPAFDKLPRDWNNEQHTFNLARRFAPKVKWPEAMDIESRTAP
jgi:hypothetical protein